MIGIVPPREPRDTASARNRQSSLGGTRESRLPEALLALTVIPLALWWMSWSLVAPGVSRHSAAAVLQIPGAPRASTPGGLGLYPSPATVERARTIVEHEPLAADAYAVLALAAEQAGQDEKAARLMQIAASWWPRDLLVQSWLFARSLRLGDRQAAVTRFDLIAHGRPDSLDDMTKLVAPLLTDPAFATALADRLATRPPWRTRFIDIAVRLWLAPAGIIGLVDRLQSVVPGLDADELRPYLSKLLATGHAEQAYLAWIHSLPSARLANLGYLYNAQFQYPIANMPFDWQFPAVANVRAKVVGDVSARSLVVGFLGGRVVLQPVQHDLVLAPGNYRLKGRVATDRLRAERGLRWRLACLDDASRPLASSDSFKGTGERDFAMDFTVPGEGCGVQVLALEIEARSSLEQEASGIATFSTLDIEPR